MTTVPRLDLPDAGKIVILNGASSSGKTSIARSLQARFGAPCHHLQLDAFRAMEPPGHWEGWEQRDARVVALQQAALCRAMNAALAEYARHGQNAIFDTALTNRDAWRYVLEDLGGLPVYLIGVTCGTEELARRELARGDRPVGLAVGQSDWIHRDKQYDLMVDTTHSTADEGAGEILAWLARAPAREAFDAMCARPWVRE